MNIIFWLYIPAIILSIIGILFIVFLQSTSKRYDEIKKNSPFLTDVLDEHYRKIFFAGYVAAKNGLTEDGAEIYYHTLIEKGYLRR